MHARSGNIVRHGERELRIGQVGVQYVDRMFLDEGLHQRPLGRHPVAEENVDLPFLKALIRDRHRQVGYVLLIAQSLQQQTGDGIGRVDIGPARIGHTYLRAALRVRRSGRDAREAEQRG